MSTDLEARVNASLMGRLTNASGLLVNGTEIVIIFDRLFASAMGGQVDATTPMCSAYDADITAHTITFGTLISINAAPYKVRSLHPDGTGLTTLMLEEA